MTMLHIIIHYHELYFHINLKIKLVFFRTEINRVLYHLLCLSAFYGQKNRTLLPPGVVLVLNLRSYFNTKTPFFFCWMQCHQNVMLMCTRYGKALGCVSCFLCSSIVIRYVTDECSLSSLWYSDLDSPLSFRCQDVLKPFSKNMFV